MFKTTSRSRIIAFAALAATSVLAAGCATEEDDVLPEESALAASSQLGADAKADHLSIPFTTFTDNIGSRGATETRKVFTSQAGYRAYFGHNAPSTVNWSRDWVVFYSAGTQRTGGFSASISYLGRSQSGRTLYVDTNLEKPGADCFVTFALTRPHVLAKFRRPTPAPTWVQYYHDDSVRNCGAVAGCEAILCITGTTCVEDASGQGSCVPAAPFCGGIAGIQCPGAGSCEDDPSDSCDPNNGGADCGGRCQCLALGLCVTGFKWDSSPGVCGCVPSAPSQCNADADCELQDNYCGGCQCDAVPVGTAPESCSNPVMCFVQPCRAKVAKCESGRCVAADAPTGGVSCGRTTCGAGLVCCNASCGICTPPDGACIQLACE